MGTDTASWSSLLFFASLRPFSFRFSFYFLLFTVPTATTRQPIHTGKTQTTSRRRHKKEQKAYAQPANKSSPSSVAHYIVRFPFLTGASSTHKVIRNRAQTSSRGLILSCGKNKTPKVKVRASIVNFILLGGFKSQVLSSAAQVAIVNAFPLQPVIAVQESFTRPLDACLSLISLFPFVSDSI